jgi:hypothetical protein
MSTLYLGPIIMTFSPFWRRPNAARLDSGKCPIRDAGNPANRFRWAYLMFAP